MPTLYDNYQLANSQGVRQYQGSALPEMIKVADVMQQRYDAAEQGMEGLQTMMNNAKVLDKDKGLFNERYGEYQKQLQEWSKRPDLENIHKDVAKSGRAFANEYKTFADNLSRAQEYQKDLDDKVDKGMLSRSTADRLLAMSHDLYGGMKRDQNGRYSGQFSGVGAAKEIDPAAFVNKALEGFMGSSVESWSEAPDGTGDYFVKTTNGTERITKDQVQSVLTHAMQSDNEFKADMAQRQKLAAWSVKGATMKDLAGTSYEADAKKYLDKGYNEKEAVMRAVADRTGSDLEADVMGMGMKKVYTKIRKGYDITGKTMQGEKKLADMDDPFTATIYQPFNPLGGVKSAAELDTAIDDKGAAYQKTQLNLSAWLHDNGVVSDKQGRMKDKNGTDVTYQYQRFIDSIAQGAKAQKDLETLRQRAMDRADFKVTPQLRKEAQEAYQKEYDRSAGPGENAAGGRDRVKDAQEAYDKVIQNSPGYLRYKQILSDMSKGQAMEIGLTTFKSKSANASAENGFKNLALNLDSDGLQFGALGLQWGTGDKAGQDLSADDYSKIREDAKFVGVGIDTDGKYKFYYKVGNVQGVPQKNGEKGAVLVKMPAMAGAAEMLVKHGQATQAEQILTQNISDIISSPSGVGTLDLGQGKVRVKRVGDAVDPNTAGTQIQLEYQGTDGVWHQRPASSRGEAVSSLINTLQQHQKK